MKLFEYQAKNIFRNHGIPVPDGNVAFTPDEAVTLFRKSGKKVAVKAQVHVGGRGKAGGVKLAGTEDEVRKAAASILGMSIKGITVDRVLVEPALEIAKEFYAGFTIDRSSHSSIFISSVMGGVEIEEVAVKSPESINKVHIDPFVGIKEYHLRDFIHQAGGEPATSVELLSLLKKAYALFESMDAGLLEINPLVVTKDGRIFAADAKMDIDDNALYRQKAIRDMALPDIKDLPEEKAKQAGLSYIKMEGNIGCVVNGAGLSMATMDVIKLFGGEPANFLDIGGSSNPEKVKTAMRLLVSDKNVKVAFFNIFGGITRCDDVARGIIAAIAELDIKIPIIIRLTGTNEEAAKKLLDGSGLIFAETMVDAAKKAVEMIR